MKKMMLLIACFASLNAFSLCNRNANLSYKVEEINSALGELKQQLQNEVYVCKKYQYDYDQEEYVVVEDLGRVTSFHYDLSNLDGVPDPREAVVIEIAGETHNACIQVYEKGFTFWDKSDVLDCMK